MMSAATPKTGAHMYKMSALHGAEIVQELGDTSYQRYTRKILVGRMEQFKMK